MTRRYLPVWLAALLFLQWGAAYGQCHVLRAAALVPGWLICASHDPSAVPEGQDSALHADWDCPACHAAPALVDVPVSAQLSVPITWEVLAFAPQPDAPGALGARAPPPPARGPPIDR